MTSWFEQHFSEDEAEKRANDKDDDFTHEDLHFLMGIGVFVDGPAKKVVTAVGDAVKHIL